MSDGPSATGRAQLAAAAAALTRGQTVPAPQARWWRRPRNLGWLLVADVVIGSILLKVVSGHQDSPATAVQGTVTLAGRGNWSGVHHRLCSADQRRFTTDQLAQAGRVAALTLRGLDHAEVTSVEPATLPLDLPVVGEVGLPVRLVRGHLIAALGPPSDFSVITVREIDGWRVCLSVGGYSSTALQVDVPIGATPPAWTGPDG